MIGRDSLSALSVMPCVLWHKSQAKSLGKPAQMLLWSSWYSWPNSDFCHPGALSCYHKDCFILSSCLLFCAISFKISQEISMSTEHWTDVSCLLCFWTTPPGVLRDYAMSWITTGVPTGSSRTPFCWECSPSRSISSNLFNLFLVLGQRRCSTSRFPRARTGSDDQWK